MSESVCVCVCVREQVANTKIETMIICIRYRYDDVNIKLNCKISIFCVHRPTTTSIELFIIIILLKVETIRITTTF